MRIIHRGHYNTPIFIKTIQDTKLQINPNTPMLHDFNTHSHWLTGIIDQMDLTGFKRTFRPNIAVLCIPLNMLLPTFSKTDIARTKASLSKHKRA